MSEPSQLVVKVQISPADYKSFRSAAPPAANPGLAWDEWLAGHRYHGPTLTRDEIENKSCKYGQPTIDAFLRTLTAEDDSNRSLDQYDLATSTWTFIVLSFSENFHDFIGTLNVLAHLAADGRASVVGHALIFSYFWEDSNVIALLTFTGDGVRLSRTVDGEAATFLQWAQQAIDERLEDR